MQGRIFVSGPSVLSDTVLLILGIQLPVVIQGRRFLFGPNLLLHTAVVILCLSVGYLLLPVSYLS